MPRERINKDEKSPITSLAIELFKRAMELERTKDDNERDYDAWNATAADLHRELGMKPWEFCVIDVVDVEAPPSPSWDANYRNSYLRAREIRKRLLSLTETDP
jgi:hypothetical protein